MRFVLRTNIFFFILFGGIILFPLESSLFWRGFRFFVGFFVLFFLPGINLAVILQFFTQKKFSFLEAFTIATTASLLLIPLLLTLEYTKFGILSPHIPIFNAFIFFLSLTSISALSKATKKFLSYDKITNETWNLTEAHTTLFSWEFISTSLFYLFFILTLTTVYFPLPDSDPYYWAQKLLTSFETGSLTLLTGDRPLFSSLSYIFTFGMRTDLYAFFKYVLPTFFLVLVPPFVLLAKTVSGLLQKIIVLLIPFASGITIIYITLPIPQAIACLAFLYFFAFLVYSHITKDNLYYWLSGLVLFLGYFYHEMLAIPLFCWLIITAIIFRTKIILLIRENLLSSIFFSILLFPYLTGPVSFLWLKIQSSLIPSLMTIHPNLLFPLYYVNVDGNEMGWGDILGVTKYYLFYIGPAVLVTAIGFIFGKNWNLKLRALKSKEYLILSLVFLLFLSLAEFFPRVTGLAFLPDRAWVFAGPTIFFLLFIIFDLPLGKKSLFLLFLIFAFSLNIAAALYINSLKKFMVTEGQIRASDWIKNSLPQDRLLFTFVNQRQLAFFSQSKVISIKNPNFFLDYSVFNNQLLAEKEKQDQRIKFYKNELDTIKKSLTSISGNSLDEERYETELSTIHNVLETIKNIPDELQILNATQSNHQYIIYIAPNPKNPYIDRPYFPKLPNQENKLIFNAHPERFKKVYADEIEHLFIWEIL